MGDPIIIIYATSDGGYGDYDCSDGEYDVCTNGGDPNQPLDYSACGDPPPPPCLADVDLSPAPPAMTVSVHHVPGHYTPTVQQRTMDHFGVVAIGVAAMAAFVRRNFLG